MYLSGVVHPGDVGVESAPFLGLERAFVQVGPGAELFHKDRDLSRVALPDNVSEMTYVAGARARSAFSPDDDPVERREMVGAEIRSVSRGGVALGAGARILEPGVAIRARVAGGRRVASPATFRAGGVRAVAAPATGTAVGILPLAEVDRSQQGLGTDPPDGGRRG